VLKDISLRARLSGQQGGTEGKPPQGTECPMRFRGG
jgi:hypothetical protein